MNFTEKIDELENTIDDLKSDNKQLLDEIKELEQYIDDNEYKIDFYDTIYSISSRLILSDYDKEELKSLFHIEFGLTVTINN